MEKGAISLQFLELCPVPVHTKAPCEFIEIARSGNITSRQNCIHLAVPPNVKPQNFWEKQKESGL